MSTRNSPRRARTATAPRPRRIASSHRKPRGSRRITAADRREAIGLIAEPVQFMDSETFHQPGAQVKIFDEAPEVSPPDTGWYHPLVNQSAAENARPASSKVLTAAEERVLFLQFNYARFRLELLRTDIGDVRPSDAQVRAVLEWNDIVHELREQIAESNLALVLAMAKRSRMSDLDFGDLVSEGNMALLRSVDKFDIGRGFKFSTYACRAILKAFSRAGMKQSKYRQRFPTEFDPALEKSHDQEERRKEDQLERAAEAVQIMVANTADLSDIEQEVLHHRFGIDAGAQGRRLTLAQVGTLIGLTKERVRQIQNRALRKLRDTLDDRYRGSSDIDGSDSLLMSN